jgi:hypothetical protein
MAKQYRDAVGPWRAYLPILDREAHPSAQIEQLAGGGPHIEKRP